MSDFPETFDWVDLNEIDPSDKPVPRDVYTFKVLSINKKEFVYKNPSKTANVGDKGEFISLKMAITDHPDFAGRKFSESLFMRRTTLQILRRIADATGVMQEPGTALDEWFAQVNEVQPEFKAPVIVVPDTEKDGKAKLDLATGKPLDKNVILWKELQVA